MARRDGKAGPEIDESDLLVLGYRGTLCPREDAPTADASSYDPPPHLEAFLAPWLDQASSQLVSRVHHALLLFAGEPIPLDGLLILLKDRLLGLVIQAMDEPSADREPPVLLHLLRSSVADWTAASLVFLQRLNADACSLAGAHGLKELPAIETITACASDVHPGGHSVLRVAFRGGPVLYYKPRPVTGEWLWHRLLEAVAQQEPGLDLSAARVFTRHERFHYGWVTSLAREDQPGGIEPAAADYWQRAGAMLCLAHHVRMTDLHLANILATQAGPAVVDAECLATPELASEGARRGRRQREPFEEALEAILATGLLARGTTPGRPDISGFFGRGGPVDGIRLPRWPAVDSGEQRLTPCAASLAEHGNAPVRTSAAAVLAELAGGYRNAAEVLLFARRRLVAKNAEWRFVLERRHAPRIVVRETLQYAQWISRSLAPKSLRSQAARRRALLTTLEAASPVQFPRALLRAESSALALAQVPRFVVAPGGRALAMGSGRAIVPGFTAETGAEAVLKQMDQLTPNHLDDVLLPALLAACLTRSFAQM